MKTADNRALMKEFMGLGVSNATTMANVLFVK